MDPGGTAEGPAAPGQAQGQPTGQAPGQPTGQAPGQPTGQPTRASDGPPEGASAPTPAEKRKALLLLGGTVAAVAAAFAAVAYMSYRAGSWKGALWFLNGDQRFTARALALSMASGVAFGLMDNSLLFFGLDALKPFLPGGELTRAGWASAFSDVVGSFAGAMVAKAIYLSTAFRGGPLYGDAAGVLVGCVLGIYIPRAITGKE